MKKPLRYLACLPGRLFGAGGAQRRRGDSAAATEGTNGHMSGGATTEAAVCSPSCEGERAMEQSGAAGAPSVSGNHVDDQLRRNLRKHIDSIKPRVFDWHFNVFELDHSTSRSPLIAMTLALLESHDLIEGWKLSRKTVETFLLRVESEYLPNSYHNAIHGADVTQTAAIILQSFSKLVDEIPKLEMFSVIIASAVHDLGHLGVNNDFLINSKHARATTYNDRSVNENYHISRAFEIARTAEGCDIFEGLTFDELKRCRKLMVDTVLATDMAIHFDLLSRFSAQLEAKPVINEWTDRNLLYQMIVHLADIANPSRPFHLARGWAERVIQEFCEQGDKEVALGLPISPFCVRETMNMPKAQQGFIEVFLRPTLLVFTKVAPDFVEMALPYLEKTIAEWKALEEAGFKM